MGDMTLADPKVAFFSYYFPPVGGGGTPRSAKFVKHLSKFGYAPTVVTVDPAAEIFEREFQADTSFDVDLGLARYSTIRVPRRKPSRVTRMARRLNAYPYLWTIAYRRHYDPARGWAFDAAKAVRRRADEEQFRLIYASAGPVATLEACSWLSEQLGVPWGADLRDLWTRDTLQFFPSRWH